VKRNTKPIRRNSPLKRSIKALKRVPLWGKPRKKTGLENEEYRNWLKTWPCFVCFREHWGPLWALNRAAQLIRQLTEEASRL
jgi:hypothetical protein